MSFKDRQIIGYTPRGNRVGRVALVLETSRDYLADSRGLLADPEAVLYGEGEGPGAAPSNRDVWRRGRDLSPLKVAGLPAHPVNCAERSSYDWPGFSRMSRAGPSRTTQSAKN
jgi:hypothetical protein